MCRSARLQREYERKYYGVFASPFDYELAVSYSQLADLHISEGIPLTDKEKEALSRLEKLALLKAIVEPAQV